MSSDTFRDTFQDPATEPPLAELAPLVLGHFNHDHPDTVLFLARVLGVRPRLTAAVARGVDAHGIELEVDGDGGSSSLRLPFSRPVGSLEELQAEAVTMVRAARERSGEPGRTSFERELDELAAITTFVTEVVRVEDVTPRLRRITFGGDDLARFVPKGPDQFLYLLVPPRGRRELTVGRDFSWEQYQRMPADERPVGAYYTVRHWRPDARELDMLFVLHGDHGEASAWASRAAPGDPAALWGPRVIFDPPPGTDWYLLVGDETGLPAIAAILETLPAGARAEVFVDVAGAEDELPLPTDADARVRWLHRGDLEAGTHAALVDAVRAMAWPDGRAYAWGGAESRAATAVRRHLRTERGLAREQVAMTGYWRHARNPVEPDELD
jgi:NADPH-dependent ferric siderophore reductase